MNLIKGQIITFKQCAPNSVCQDCGNSCFNRALYRPNYFYGKFLRGEYSANHGHTHIYVEMNDGNIAIIDECFIRSGAVSTRVERMTAV